MYLGMDAKGMLGNYERECGEIVQRIEPPTCEKESAVEKKRVRECETHFRISHLQQCLRFSTMKMHFYTS